MGKSKQVIAVQMVQVDSEDNWMTEEEREAGVALILRD